MYPYLKNPLFFFIANKMKQFLEISQFLSVYVFFFLHIFDVQIYLNTESKGRSKREFIRTRFQLSLNTMRRADWCNRVSHVALSAYALRKRNRNLKLVVSVLIESDCFTEYCAKFCLFCEVSFASLSTFQCLLPNPFTLTSKLTRQSMQKLCLLLKRINKLYFCAKCLQFLKENNLFFGLYVYLFS